MMTDIGIEEGSKGHDARVLIHGTELLLTTATTHTHCRGEPPRMNEYPQVGEPRVGQKTSTIAEPEEAPPAPSSTVTVCYFNGDPYSRGAVVCSAGRQLTCGNDGRWYLTGNC
jgi:hypothetical protein